MRKLVLPGRIMFALCIISLGVLQYFAGDYIVGRPPSPEWSATIPGKLIWAYVSGALLIIAGIAIILKIRGAFASLFIAALIIVASFLLRNLPVMTTAGKAEDLLWFINAYKALALAGGAMIIAASLYKESNYDSTGILKNKNLIGVGCFLLALFFIICGLSHFKFFDFVAHGFIPSYIPAQSFWTYFTGVALLAGGVGLLIKPLRQWAAFFSGLMILLWFLLLHIPRLTYTPKEYGEWMGVFESFGFSGICFVLAGLFSGQRRISKI
ncbi:MAG: hypothetical protein ABIR18_12545 [Chitinophagaceae bacterium]